MQLGELVGFKSDRFFEGAVQLRWVEERMERAADAAEHFVFHGPHYHGVSQDDSDGISSAYKLKDTATLLMDFVASIASGESANVNPFTLVVAGYGSGKSHFALTLAKLLMSPTELLACKIVHSIRSADEEIGERVGELLERVKKPSLVVALDGMSNFHLGSELSRGVLRQLKENNLDLGPILELSPRFGYAQDFVRRNYEIRKSDFEKDKLLQDQDKDAICSALQENDDNVYQAVDDIYFKANGTRIPVEGRESAQDLINTACEVYCGENGYFSSLVILFDEFGRYLEYAAAKPWLAGDSALQQIFQGIQDNAGLSRFVGFIQYELKAYLNRFSQKELSQLQRYITRFDSAQKLFLSTNLETLFAHLIEKKDPAQLNAIVELEHNKRTASEAHTLLCQNLPGIDKFPVWKDSRQFHQVIVKGCWPLHPLTTWFLTRQQDIVQSRSALTFIKDILEAASGKKIDPEEPRFYTIPPAELVLRSMLEEITAAERSRGGVIAETLCSVLEKYKARLTEQQRLVLAGIMILDKLRVATKDKGQIDRLLQLCTELSPHALDEALRYLSNEIGAVEWNRDLCQYELVADAATRGQFQQVLKRKLLALDSSSIGELFATRARVFGEIGDIETDFAVMRDIFSRDWCFSALFVHCDNYLDTITRAFEEWWTAENHDEAKGRVLYLYIGPREDPGEYLAQSQELLNMLLGKKAVQAAPVWTIAIHDTEGTIAENLGRIHVLEDRFLPEEAEKYRRFLPEERERTLRVLRDEMQKAVQQRVSSVAGLDTVVGRRLRQTAQWIFEQVYPSVFPFPFDGFQNKTGSGPKECLQLTRALIGRQVSGDWIATQSTQIQNRVNRLFVKSWKVLGNDGKVALKPGLKELAALLYSVEETLKQPNATLYDTYSALIAPPYGFNSSSAGLIIGLVLARETPPRALSCQGVSIGVQEWLTRAFPKGGKVCLDKSCLKSTAVTFLSEDTLHRWKKVIADLESEENLRKKLELFAAAKRMLQTEPVPETLLGRFEYLTEKVSDAQIRLAEHTRKVQSLERSLEVALQKSDIANIIRWGSDLRRLQKDMEAEAELWGSDDLQEIKGLVGDALHALGNRVAAWVAEETCNGYGQLNTFRFKMDKSEQNLKFLELDAEATLVENHKNRIISQVEIRMKYETSITSAQDLVRQPAPSKSSAAWKLKDEIKTCNSSIENLKKANSEIGGPDIMKLIEQVQSRKERAKLCIKEQEEELDAICNLKITTPQDIAAVRNKLAEQAVVFKGTTDEAYLADMNKQLDILLGDMNAWGSALLSPEDTDRVLKERIAERCTHLKSLFDDEEMEQTWNFEDVYSNYREYLVNERWEQSTKWFSTVRPDVTAFDTWTLTQCQKQLTVISDPPKFLSVKHAEEIDKIARQIRQRAENLKEQEREATALKWIEGIRSQLEPVDALSGADCERLLRALATLPESVSEKEMHHVVAMRAVLTRRHDSLDIKSILDRICHLRDELRECLFKELCRLYKLE